MTMPKADRLVDRIYDLTDIESDTYSAVFSLNIPTILLCKTGPLRIVKGFLGLALNLLLLVRIFNLKFEFWNA